MARSYKNDEFDWSFSFRDCIMRVMEVEPSKIGSFSFVMKNEMLHKFSKTIPE